MPETTLPEEFQDLECWSAWCLDTEIERIVHRQESSFEELKAFYDAMLPKAEDALTYLKCFPMDDLPADAGRLYLLTLSLAEVAPAIELFGQVSVVDGYDILRVKPVQRA